MSRLDQSGDEKSYLDGDLLEDLKSFARQTKLPPLGSSSSWVQYRPNLSSTSLREDSSALLPSTIHRSPSLSTLGLEARDHIACDDVIINLGFRGCQNLTDQLNPESFGVYAKFHGGFGDIHPGRLHDGFEVAIKTTRVRNYSRMPQKSLLDAAWEADTWSKCQHKNMLPFLGVVNFRGEFGMVSPWTWNGNLRSYHVGYPVVDRCRMSAEICEGLTYLHSQGIVHGDLKGANIMVFGAGIPMIADFGNAIQQKSESMLSATTRNAWSLRWAAPELMNNSGVRSFASDVYALGMTIIETLTDDLPYASVPDRQVHAAMALGKNILQRPQLAIPSTSKQGDTLWSLLKTCWELEPEKRPSANHVWNLVKTITPEGLALRIDELNTVLNSLMNVDDVIALLREHGCENISFSLDLPSCGLRPISCGGTGDVYQGKLHSGSQVAIKTMRLQVNSHEGQKPLKDAARELHKWSKCHHPNVVRLLGLVEFHEQIGMVSLWMKNGSLPDYLGRRPTAKRIDISTGICEGLTYLHGVNIVHGDLKGLNVLVSDDGKPMLADFGNAVLRDSTLKFTTTTTNNRISARWTAPELLEGSGTCSFASDVYALGMTILETIIDEVPYVGMSDHMVILAICRKKKAPPRPPLSIPLGKETDKLWSLLERCWGYSPESRPRAFEVWNEIKVKVGTRLGPRLEVAETFLNSITSMEDGIAHLDAHGCENLSSSLDPTSFNRRASWSDSYDIYEGRLRGGSLVAIKIQSSYATSHYRARNLQDTIADICAGSKLQHPNVLGLIGVVKFRRQIGTVSLWMNNGRLLSYLKNHPDIDRCKISAGICEGLAYLHAINIAYPDLKVEYVLISGDGIPLLTNPNPSTIFQRKELKTRGRPVPPDRWMIHLDTGSFAPDVYALGMTILETVTGRLVQPVLYEFPERPEEEIPSNSLNGNSLWRLLESCWAGKPEARPSAEDVSKSMKAITQEGLKPQ